MASGAANKEGRDLSKENTTISWADIGARENVRQMVPKKTTTPEKDVAMEMDEFEDDHPSLTDERMDQGTHVMEADESAGQVGSKFPSDVQDTIVMETDEEQPTNDLQEDEIVEEMGSVSTATSQDAIATEMERDDRPPLMAERPLKKQIRESENLKKLKAENPLKTENIRNMRVARSSKPNKPASRGKDTGAPENVIQTEPIVEAAAQNDVAMDEEKDGSPTLADGKRDQGSHVMEADEIVEEMGSVSTATSQDAIATEMERDDRPPLMAEGPDKKKIRESENFKKLKAKNLQKTDNFLNLRDARRSKPDKVKEQH
ncbi:uncharacterized protein LOC110987714 [Acanthaster planci]|uniref:Uncharacterized protein LOC110987714 n=1 Tax=Acanthaster planci TaxID=133434 RepID=A0A8B7ZLA5_ACAPL|nr:uncharacterized protein LOC110987714 [Acanthaster planci]